jgi:hypothetical protein
MERLANLFSCTAFCQRLNGESTRKTKRWSRVIPPSEESSPVPISEPEIETSVGRQLPSCRDPQNQAVQQEKPKAK